MTNEYKPIQTDNKTTTRIPSSTTRNTSKGFKLNPRISYWEKKTFLTYDHIIVGGGLVGLSTAISLMEKQPDLKVLILERDIIPHGASTKNAGFACVGSLTEIISDLKIMSEDEVFELISTRYNGLNLLRKRLGDSKIGYKENGSYELIDSNSHLADRGILVDKINEINGKLKKVFSNSQQDAFTLCSDQEMKSFGFSKELSSFLIKNNFEGELDTGMMMNELTKLALSYGVQIKTGCNVLDFKDHESNNGVSVRVSSGSGEPITFKAISKLFICTNAFTGELIKGIDIIPGKGQVLITNPIPGLSLKGIYHFDEGYYYFREKDGCLLFGGGRNLDFKKEETTDFSANEKILNKLYELLKYHIFPNTPFTIQTNWTGIMAFGKDKKPIIKHHSENVILGVRMGGMGVAISSLVGRKLSDMALLNSKL